MKYVILFKGLEEVHWVKDVGMIPRTLSRFGHEVTILTDRDYDRFDSYGVQVVNLRRISTSYIFGVVWWIVKNAKDIDVLHLFHLSKWSFFYALWFKLIRFRGIVYLKMDADDPTISRWEQRTGGWRLFLYKIGWSPFNLVSIETAEAYERVCNIWPFLKSRLKLLPNGVDVDRKLLFSDFIDKKNDYGKYILFVGRVGAWQKGIDILLDSYFKLGRKVTWKLLLVGPVESIFMDEWTRRSNSEYTDVYDKVIFLGNVNQRNQLENLYLHALAFVLPSRWESFGIALVEAASCGCPIISTDVGIAKDVVGKMGYGQIIEYAEPNLLTQALLQVKDEISPLERVISGNIIRESYSYNMICSQLEKYLISLLGGSYG